MQQDLKSKARIMAIRFVAGYSLLFLQACSTGQDDQQTNEIKKVSIAEIRTASSETLDQYAGSVSGVNNVEIRPQVEGYLEKIYVDEGAYVTKGQLLFLINENQYSERLNKSNAGIATAKANLEKAQIEYDRVERLSVAKVISEVQVKTARSELAAARARLSEANAEQKGAAINKGFTQIKAPVSGYLGGIPYKLGSLVGRNELSPLTVLSDISRVYVYFSMSEEDFLDFKNRFKGNSIEEKLEHIPEVSLLLPDNTTFSEKGKIDLVLGQFDKNTAAISFRASFKNPGGLLRSGNTGKIVLPRVYPDAIKIPQSATFEIQDKKMVYTVNKQNKLVISPVNIIDKDAHSYIIAPGVVAPGDRIVTRGTERLKEGELIKPILE